MAVWLALLMGCVADVPTGPHPRCTAVDPAWTDGIYDGPLTFEAEVDAEPVDARWSLLEERDYNDPPVTVVADGPVLDDGFTWQGSLSGGRGGPVSYWFEIQDRWGRVAPCGRRVWLNEAEFARGPAHDDGSGTRVTVARTRSPI